MCRQKAGREMGIVARYGFHQEGSGYCYAVITAADECLVYSSAASNNTSDKFLASRFFSTPKIHPPP